MRYMYTINILICNRIPGVDDTSNITLMYPGNRMAVLTISLSCDLAKMATVMGTKGVIKV